MFFYSSPILLHTTQIQTDFLKEYSVLQKDYTMVSLLFQRAMVMINHANYRIDKCMLIKLYPYRTLRNIFAPLGRPLNIPAPPAYGILPETAAHCIFPAERPR